MDNVAIIDIGSNSVRMVIFDYAHKSPLIIFNERIFCGLARNLDKTKKLNKKGSATALLALHGFALLAKAKSIKKIITIGTAALREAKDSADFIKKVYKLTKLKIKIVSGNDEAYYAARGVLSLNPKAKGFIADFGGGSLEIAQISKNNIKDKISLPLGAYRVLPYLDTGYEFTKNILDQNISIKKNVKNLYVIGGSWRALLQAYTIEHKQDIKDKEYKVAKDSLYKFCKKIESINETAIIKRYKLEIHRAHLLKVSSIILRATIDKLGVEFIIPSKAGIRDGILYEFLKDRHG